MTTSGRSGWWKLGLGSALAMGGAMTASGDEARAQITPDATLGTENSVVTPNVTIRDLPSDRIDGGAARGANLFHSFREFNIGEGRGAYFTNPTGIENILSRVTGGNVSNILGKLGVLGNANLFLINPNGIIFGPNASLDIRGSFVGSTASAVNFADGTHFSATAPSTTPLLTVSVPLGLQYGGNAGSVQVQQSALQVDTGQTLALVGGNVSVDGGRLQAAGGRVELGGLAQAGWVGLNVDSNQLSLSFPDGATAQMLAPRADVSLTNAASVRVAASGGGSIALNARNLEVLEGSSLIAGIGEGLGFAGIEAGDVSLSATEAIAIGQSSSIQNRVNQNAIGNSGDINVQARSLSITDGAFLSASNAGHGNAGIVSVQATDSVWLADSNIFSNVNATGVGNVGSVVLEAGSVSLTNGSQLQASINAGGHGNNPGMVSVRGRDSVSFEGSGIFSDVESGAVGNGSDIEISARSVSLTDGALLNASNAGQGNAGRVSVQATDSVWLADSNIFSNVESGGVGNVGSVLIEAGSVSLTNGAQLQAGIDSGGQGNAAGIISVRGRNSVSFVGRGSGIFSDVESESVGNGSDIQISAGSVSLTDGAILKATNAGRGIAGSISLQATDLVLLENSNIFSDLESGAEGNAGNINITAGSLSLTDGAQLSTSTFGHGNAGIVSVQTRDSVALAGSGTTIFTNVEPGSFGNGNDITINAGSLSLTDGAQLQTLVREASEDGTLSAGRGNAGNVNIEVRDHVTINNIATQISSNVGYKAVGNGGNINITARSLSLTDNAALFTSTLGQGDAGSVSVRATDSVSLANSAILTTVDSEAVGNGDNINITAGSLSLTDGARLNASTFGHGDAGNISVRVDNAVSLTNDSYIIGFVGPGGVGNSGDIDIHTRSLSLTNGSQIGAAVFRQFGGRPGGQGRGGNILVNTSDSVTLSGIGSTGFSSGLLALTERGASGEAGNITVNTGNFRVADGAIVAASTFNSGDGGDITINAQTFEALNGGQVLTNTRSSGNAGNITLNVTDRITLSGSDPNFAARLAQVEQRLQSPGETDQVSDVFVNEGSASGLFANTAPGPTGNGGSIFIINPIQLTITDGAGVSVDSQGQGNAGNLQIQAGSVILDRGAFLSATTASGKNGNITLRSQDLLLLRRNSQISTAARGTGNGGNIDIDAGFIVALPSEDSNIIADAIEGQGGNINITARGIFGIQAGEQQTSQSDITASSKLGIDGEVEINTPDVDPNQGLTTLPAELVDASRLIATGCSADGESVASNKFIITGRGGLPPNPGDTLSGEAVLVNWATLDPEVENSSGAEETATNPTRERAPTQIVEAQGWVFGPKGEVILTASAPTVTPHSAWLPTVDCSN